MMCGRPSASIMMFGRLQVAVDHTPAVRRAARASATSASRRAAVRLRRGGPAANRRGQVGPDGRGGDVEGVAVPAGVVDRHDVRVAEPRGDVPLAEEPLGIARGTGPVRPGDLHGDRASQLGVPAAEDDPGRPLADDLQQLITPECPRPIAGGRPSGLTAARRSSARDVGRGQPPGPGFRPGQRPGPTASGRTRSNRREYSPGYQVGLAPPPLLELGGD